VQELGQTGIAEFSGFMEFAIQVIGGKDCTSMNLHRTTFEN
jgi:hypothetical protein